MGMLTPPSQTNSAGTLRSFSNWDVSASACINWDVSGCINWDASACINWDVSVAGERKSCGQKGEVDVECETLLRISLVKSDKKGKEKGEGM